MIDTDKLELLIGQLYWFKDQVEDNEGYMKLLLEIAKEVGDDKLEGDVKNYLEIQGRL